jgi:DNA invertase Pin-like site-specific DNA recombinase
MTAAGEDTSNEDPTRVLFRQILGSLAEYDRVMTVRKLKASRDRARRRDGRNEGQKYYGELEGEAEVASQIRALRDDGYTLLAIAQALNANKVKPRRGKQWYASSVKNVVDGEERLARRLEANRAMA